MTDAEKLGRVQRKVQRLREDVEILAAAAASGVEGVNMRGVAARLAAIAALLEDRPELP